jgi:hypothetical protein
MLYLTIFIYCFATALSSSVQNPILSGGGTATTVRIPGNTNARYCSDHENDIFMIERVDLVPNPPIPYVTPLHAHTIQPYPSDSFPASCCIHDNADLGMV